MSHIGIYVIPNRLVERLSQSTENTACLCRGPPASPELQSTPAIGANSLGTPRSPAVNERLPGEAREPRAPAALFPTFPSTSELAECPPSGICSAEPNRLHQNAAGKETPNTQVPRASQILPLAIRVWASEAVSGARASSQANPMIK